MRGKVKYVEMKDDEEADDAELSRRWWDDYGRWNGECVCVSRRAEVSLLSLAHSFFGPYTPDSPIKSIFAGQLASSVTCTYCRHVSKSFDPFWDLSLPIPRGGSGDAVNLNDCLRAFLTAETVRVGVCGFFLSFSPTSSPLTFCLSTLPTATHAAHGRRSLHVPTLQA